MAMVPARRIAATLSLCLALPGLAGCASLANPDHLRLCRSLLPALHAEGTTIRETRHFAVENRINRLRIDYLSEEPGRPRGTHYAICAFAGGGADASRLDLAALETERGPITGTKLYILKRWWLGDKAPIGATRLHLRPAGSAR